MVIVNQQIMFLGCKLLAKVEEEKTVMTAMSDSHLAEKITVQKDWSLRGAITKTVKVMILSQAEGVFYQKCSFKMFINALQKRPKHRQKLGKNRILS